MEPLTAAEPHVARPDPGPPGRPVGFGRYEPREPLGSGGMGEVWLAWDPVLEREVAVKHLRLDRAEVGAERFRDEARVVAGLAHPGIVPVFDLGDGDDGRPFLVMRRVGGRSLDALGEAPLLRRLDIFERICDAVGFAHRNGVIHRDLKPANVMVGDDGEVLVLDWGVARRSRAVAPLPDAPRGETLPGTIVGTFGYLAPEAADGDVASHSAATDVFSLGAILYELLTGRPAIDGPDLWLATLEAKWTPVRALQPDIDPALALICERCLSLYPFDRYADARVLGDALRAWRQGAARRAVANARAADGRRQLVAWQAAAADLGRRRDALDAATRVFPPGLPLDDPRRRALDAEGAQVELAAAAVAVQFAGVEAAGQGALAAWAECPAGRALLADAYLTRLLAAEVADRPSEVAYWAARLAAHDDGSRAAMLAAPGRITLDTLPSGAEVVARPVDRSEVVFTLGAPRAVGRTPLVDAELPVGSWSLEIRAEGRAPVTLPLLVHRDERVVYAEPVPLPPLAAVEGDRWVVVPPGPWIRGGDPDVSFPRPKERVWGAGFLIARHATTAAEYARFLEDLHRNGEDWRRRAPRAGARMWPGEPPFQFPLVDVDGDPWSADFPIMGIDHDDASAYAAWAGARLLTDDEFEQAARGADGRRHPWGDRFDPSVCKCGPLRPGRPQPEPIGAVPTDRSPYGVHDLGGSMRTWCAGDHFEGDPALRPIRGGQWNAFERVLRSANRLGLHPASATTYLGLRLARDLPKTTPH